jgi:hypothetical protein
MQCEILQTASVREIGAIVLEPWHKWNFFVLSAIKESKTVLVSNKIAKKHSLFYILLELHPKSSRI